MPSLSLTAIQIPDGCNCCGTSLHVSPERQDTTQEKKRHRKLSPFLDAWDNGKENYSPSTLMERKSSFLWILFFFPLRHCYGTDWTLLHSPWLDSCMLSWIYLLNPGSFQIHKTCAPPAPGPQPALTSWTSQRWNQYYRLIIAYRVGFLILSRPARKPTSKGCKDRRAVFFFTGKSNRSGLRQEWKVRHLPYRPNHSKIPFDFCNCLLTTQS